MLLTTSSSRGVQHGIPLPATSTSASVGTLLRRISSAVSPSGTWDQAILRDLTEDRFREQTAYGQKVLEQVLMAIETSVLAWHAQHGTRVGAERLVSGRGLPLLAAAASTD